MRGILESLTKTFGSFFKLSFRFGWTGHKEPKRKKNGRRYAD